MKFHYTTPEAHSPGGVKNNFDKICIRDCGRRGTKWRLKKKIEKNNSVFVRNGSKNVECKYTKSDVGYATLAK